MIMSDTFLDTRDEAHLGYRYANYTEVFDKLYTMLSTGDFFLYFRDISAPEMVA